jgi:hypothetical protein
MSNKKNIQNNTVILFIFTEKIKMINLILVDKTIKEVN